MADVDWRSRPHGMVCGTGTDTLAAVHFWRITTICRHVPPGLGTNYEALAKLEKSPCPRCHASPHADTSRHGADYNLICAAGNFHIGAPQRKGYVVAGLLSMTEVRSSVV